MASPIFNPPRTPKSLESLAQEEIRAILSAYHQGETLVVAADTQPNLFALALSKVQVGEDFILRAINLVGSRPQPRVHLVRCNNPGLLIGNLLANGKFPSDSQNTLEDYLFDILGEAFLAVGFKVDKGLPDRYHRRLLI